MHNVMHKEPLITVLMPLRAFHPEFLNLALDSMQQQSSPDWALKIIVEDSDKVKFTRLLNRPLQDTRVELVINQGRKLAGAFNSGIKSAASEFVAILLGDDQWATHAVEALSDAVRTHPEADFFHSSRRFIDQTGAFISSVYPCRRNVTLADFKTDTPVKHLLCWRRSLALECGGLDESLNSVGPDDFDFPWTMAEHGAKFQSIDECLYLYREHDECFRLTTGLPRSVHKKEIKRVLQKHGLEKSEIDAWIRKGERLWLKQCKYNYNWQRWYYRLTGKKTAMHRPEYK